MKQETINNIVKATGVSAGELVLIHFWGEDKDKEIANKFYIAVASLGASPFLLQQARTVNRNTFLVAGDSCFDERYFNLFSGFQGSCKRNDLHRSEYPRPQMQKNPGLELMTISTA